jgi:general secretion pathway protein M
MMGLPVGLAMELPVGRRGQVVAVGLLLIVLGLAWSLVASPLIGWYEVREERVAEQQALLARMTQLVAQIPALRQAAGGNDGQANDVPAATLLSGESDAVAGAALQGMVQDMARTAGVALTSAEALPGDPRGAFRRIGLRIMLNADWPALIDLLRSIEGSPMRLLVDDLQLHATANTQAAATHDAPQIEASFVVLGFRAGGADRPQAAGPTAHADLSPALQAEASAQRP